MGPFRLDNGPRRESASAVDDFFCDPSPMDLNVNVNLRVLTHPRVPDVSSMAKGNGGLNHDRIVSLRQQTMHQTRIPCSTSGTSIDNYITSSSSIVDEIFGATSTSINTSVRGSKAKTTCSSHIDIKPKFSNNQLHTALGAMDKPSQGPQMCESLWEDLSTSISLVENHVDMVDQSAGLSDNVPSSCAMNINPIDIKTEPIDIADSPPSCSYHNTTGVTTPTIKQEGLYGVAVTSTTTGFGGSGRPSYLPISDSNQMVRNTNCISINVCTPHVEAGLRTSSTNCVVMGSKPTTNGTHNITLHHQQQHISAHTYALANNAMPPTPPDSQPGSPNKDLMRHTPPPPYPGLTCHSSRHSTKPQKPRMTHPGCTTIMYNRKNNPELEKRRVHYCNFPGENFI